MCKSFKKILCTAIVVTTIFTSVGCGLIKDPKSKMTAELLKPEERKFQNYEVATGNLRYEHTFNGKVTSKNVININAAVAGGVLEQVNVNTWDKVKKGDIIAKCYTKNIENKIEIQEIAVQESEDDLNAVKNDNNANQYRIEKAELALKRQKAILNQLLEDKEALIFRSPIDGIVVTVTGAKRGTTIGMNEIIATIMDSNELLVTAAPELTELKNYYVGMKGQIAYQNKPYKAEVKEISLEDNPDARNKRGVLLEFKDQIPKELKVGDNVTYKVFGDEKQNVIIIPTNFLKVDELEKIYVYVMKEGIREKRFIEIGISDGKFIEVKSGLEVKENIILN